MAQASRLWLWANGQKAWPTVWHALSPFNGLRNRDLRQVLYDQPATPEERRRRSGAITRKLRLLRAHGLIHKVPRSQRYVVSPKGRQAITALLAARNANTKELTKLVA